MLWTSLKIRHAGYQISHYLGHKSHFLADHFVGFSVSWDTLCPTFITVVTPFLKWDFSVQAQNLKVVANHRPWYHHVKTAWEYSLHVAILPVSNSGCCVRCNRISWWFVLKVISQDVISPFLKIHQRFIYSQPSRTLTSLPFWYMVWLRTTNYDSITNLEPADDWLPHYIPDTFTACVIYSSQQPYDVHYFITSIIF